MSRAQQKLGLLAALDGKYGETLSSAMLGHILRQNNSAINAAFLELCSPTSPRVSLGTEILDVDVEAGRKREGDTDRSRVDLILQTPTYFIGIENKIWAPLQENQPSKYLPHLIDRAAAANSTAHAYGKHLVVIVPQTLRRRTLDAVVLQRNQMEGCTITVVTWQGVVAKLCEAANTLTVDRVLVYLTEQLRDYIHSQMWDLSKVSSVWQGVTAHIDRGWGSDQYDFLSALASIINGYFDSTTGGAEAIRPAGHTRGFAFGRAQRQEMGWVGLVEGEQFLSAGSDVDPRSIYFVVALWDSDGDGSFRWRKAVPEGSPFRRDPMIVSGWNRQWKAWLFQPNEIQNSYEAWTETLRCAIDEVHSRNAELAVPIESP